MKADQRLLAVCCLVLAGASAPAALGNGGPFMIKYPGGDPAARGTPARLDPDLRPGREDRLRVLKEDLIIKFGVPEHFRLGSSPATVGVASSSRRTPSPPAPNTTISPLADVSAAYTIENPTDSEIAVDFGFPILRGIYINPYSMTMLPTPEMTVTLDSEQVNAHIISNSAIYGLIRRHSREAIEKYIASDARLADLVARVRLGIVRQRAREAAANAAGKSQAFGELVAADPDLAPLLAVASDLKDPAREAARGALRGYLLKELKWDPQPAGLLVEYASLDTRSTDQSFGSELRIVLSETDQLISEALGPLAAIGEQKATQFFVELARKIDPKLATSYEDIFAAWGGDVRERSCDLTTGKVRPREVALDDAATKAHAAAGGMSDPTLYARMRYFDEGYPMSPGERDVCQRILAELPVVFTFAPMNLVHYQLKFPPRSQHVLTVSYRQFAYFDTAGPRTYQLSYVIHPASLWKEFGPIHLKIVHPQGVAMNASVAMSDNGVEEHDIGGRKYKFAVKSVTLTDKTGELFVALDADAWDSWLARPQTAKDESADQQTSAKR